MASFQPNLDSEESSHKKRRKIGDRVTHHHSLNLIPWRSHTEHRIYSSRLLEALRHVRRRNPSPTVAKPIFAARQVRETADRVLAATAKGRTRWSRAILATPMGRWKLQRRQHKKVVKKAAKGLKRAAVSRATGDRRRSSPAAQKKARVLSRLVPGCRKLSFPNLLEEATDYISALEMQVRSMTALTELLDGGSPADRVGWTRP